jgi:hypothetical protein
MFALFLGMFLVVCVLFFINNSIQNTDDIGKDKIPLIGVVVK